MADKYQVDSLRAVSAHYLGNNLTATNAMEVLVLADRSGAAELRSKALAYLSKHRRSVAEAGCFEDLTAELARDVFRALAKA